MKVLVTILTSYNIDLLERCVNSIINQYIVPFKYDIKIVVNTLNEKYFPIVMNKYKNTDIEIIQTESNGYPGKGHNSVFNLFKERTEYNYLMPIDGDDLYYPSAIVQLAKTFKYKPDIIHLMINDYVTCVNKKIRHIKLSGNFKLYSSINDEVNWWKKVIVKDPYKNNIELCKTPSRIMLASRNIFNTTIPLIYDEECVLYDDYLSFLSFCENYFTGQLNIFAISNNDIYCYNATNMDSASRKFNSNNFNTLMSKETILFRTKGRQYKNCLQKFEKDDNNWNLTALPFITLGKNVDFTLRKKIKFCEENIVQFEIRSKTQQADMYFKQKDYKNAENYYNILHNYGVKAHSLYENMGLIYYVSKNYKKSVGSYINALEIKKTFLVYKNLFIIYKDLGNINLQIKFLKKALMIQDDINLRKYLHNIKTVDITECNDIKYENKIVTINSYTKPILCYYTGYSESFNGKNYGDKQVYGSEIAAVKLCEKLSQYYTVFVFCRCDEKEEIKFNNVTYFSIYKYELFQKLYPVEVLIVSRFVHFFINYKCLAKKIYFLLHDARIHNYWINKALVQCGNPFFRNIIHNLNKIVCVSHWQKNYFSNFAKIPKNYITVISNGYNSTNFQNIILEQKIKNKFIYCSDTSRGLSILLKIFPIITNKFPDASLDIYFGTISPILQKEVNKQKNVIFHGKISNKELSNKLRTSEIWCYPNLTSHETFCLCALEAMAAGNVVIARKYSGIVETVSDSGILLIAKNTQEYEKLFLDNIFDILENDEKKKYYQKKAITRAKIYDWNNIAEQWYKLINI